MRRIRPDELDASLPLGCDVLDHTGHRILAMGSVPQAQPAWARWLAAGLYVDELLLWQQPPRTARQLIYHAIATLAPVLANPAACRDFSAEILAVVDMVQEAWQRDRDVTTAMVMLCRDGPHAARQAIYTACVVLRVWRGMGGLEETEAPLLAAALSLQLDVQAAPRTLSSVLALRQPDLGDLLPRLGVHDQRWLESARQADILREGGDPAHRLRERGVSDAAQLIALADLFCFHADHPETRQGGQSRAVLRDLLISHGEYYDVQIASYFIRAMGLYPLGTVVQLASGEIGVVCDQGEQLDTPWICSLFTPAGTPLPEPALRDTSIAGNAIQQSLSAAALPGDVSLVGIWGEEARDYGMPHALPVHSLHHSV
ncbi:hypothetical protein QWZ03_19105 [Chitinimonas viridis]|uniref:Uncharacterized protein n=1 Tax=Chitinimonas viridis TaxID=664880 RepID=A0ABT8BBL6_9NEIS|nr:hypothetical protein [Chitinimonas viridis]MDN3578879.1 hypothetical protein [Chitinimonas viridis]